MSWFKVAVLSVTVFRRACLGSEFVSYTDMSFVHDILLDVDAAWVATSGGVVKYGLDGNLLAAYTATDGLPATGTYEVECDRAGNKWFCTRDGVSRFDGTSWTTYDTLDGLAHNHALSVAMDSSGNLWFGTVSGVSRFDGSSWQTYDTSNGLPYHSVAAIAVDDDGFIWCGTRGGASVFDGTVWTTYDQSDGLVCRSVLSIAVDREGNKWFATENGISTLTGSDARRRIDRSGRGGAGIQMRLVGDREAMTALVSLPSSASVPLTVSVFTPQGRCLRRAHIGPSLDGTTHRLRICAPAGGMYVMTAHSDGAWVRQNVLVVE